MICADPFSTLDVLMQKGENMKKIFALLLATVMMLSLIAVPVSAEGGVTTVSEITPGSAENPTLDDVLNVPGGNISFTSTGDHPWAVDGENGWANTTNQNVGSSSSTVTAVVTAAEGDVITFDYRVSSEGRYDVFKFSIDGECVGSSPWSEWSGDLSWTSYAHALTAGEHTLSWSYVKDSSVNKNEDTAWLDNVYVGEPIHPTSVEITETATVPLGRRFQLEWTVLPENAFDKSVSFASSNESVATVDQSGLVTGVATGEATITVTTVDGEVTDTCLVTVAEGIPPVQLYGYMSGRWISFTDVEPAYTSELGISGLSATAAEFAGGKVYGFNSDKQFFILDLESLSVEYPGASSTGVTIRDMAYDHSSQTMYAYGVNSDSVRTLYIVDRATGALTEVAPIICGNENVMTLAIATDGTAYALTESYSASKLYSIDLETGTGTLIGSTGLALKREQSLAYDHNTNQLFWARFSDYDDTGLSIIDTSNAYVNDCGQIGGGGQLYGLFIPNSLPVSEPIASDCTVTFVDGVSGAVLNEIIVENGSALTDADYPEAPAHDGYAFIGWSYDGAAIYSDITVTAEYFDLNTVSITLLVESDATLDGSGFQMLIDADATEYGLSIPTGSQPLAYGENAADIYSLFEYKLPQNADGDLTTEYDIVFGGDSVTITIPAGVYDFCIVNPQYWNDDGPVIDFVSDIGNANGRNNDYAFEAGKSYVFTVYRYGELSAVDVEITDYNPEPVFILGDIDGNGAVTATDALLVMRYALSGGTLQLTEAQLLAADYDGDGTASLPDALAILRHALALE